MAAVDIANMALGRVGIGQAIQSLGETSVNARTCNRFYEHCRDEVLRSFPWGIALYAEELAVVSDQDFPGYEYVYQQPDDCLRMLAVADEGGMRMVYHQVCAHWDRFHQLQRELPPWRMALKADGASAVILTDTPDAWGFFIRRVTNTNVFPPDLTSLIAWRLAMEIAGPLQVKADLRADATRQYMGWASWAQATAFNEGHPDPAPDSPSIACR